MTQGHASSAIPTNVRAEQVAFWVRELIDIMLLDYLFSQQDRIGNIDYVGHWVWLVDGQVRQQPAIGCKPPVEIAARSPRLLKRTELGDNDAGVRMSYANFTQRTGMLERIRRHYPHTYRQLMRLDADFDRVAANVKSAAGRA